MHLYFVSVILKKKKNSLITRNHRVFFLPFVIEESIGAHLHTVKIIRLKVSN